MDTNTFTPETTGTFEVITAAGTSFILEFGTERHLTRKPGMHPPAEGMDEPKRIPGDFGRLPMLSVPAVKVGHPAVFDVRDDEMPMRLHTTEVTSIRRLT